MPTPFQNSDKRRRDAMARATNLAAAHRTMRDLRDLSSRRTPQKSQIITKISELLRIAMRLGDAKLANGLRASLNKLQGNLSYNAAQQVFKNALALGGPVGRAVKATVDLDKAASVTRKAIGNNLHEATAILETLQGKAAPESVGAKKAMWPPARREYKPSGPPMPYNTRMLPNGLVNVKTPNFNRSYRATDPTITGAMIPVASSNVYAIGYKFAFNNPTKGILYVQFLGGGTKKQPQRSGPGHLYEYFDIHPDKFQQMRKAASKGGWVWDELRVRGSRVLHQVKYSLKAFAGGYLPRQAAVLNGRAMFIPRTRQGRAKLGDPIKTYRSSLPLEDLGPVRRGRPNNGRPRNGR